MRLCSLGNQLPPCWSQGHDQTSERGNSFAPPNNREPPDVQRMASCTTRIDDATLIVQDAMTRISFSGLLNNGRTNLPIIGERRGAGSQRPAGCVVALRRRACARPLRDRHSDAPAAERKHRLRGADPGRADRNPARLPHGRGGDRRRLPAADPACGTNRGGRRITRGDLNTQGTQTTAGDGR